MQENLAPIVLFVYARPHHTLQTLQTLEKNTLAQQSILYIYADGLKEDTNDETLANFQATREIIRRNWQFREVHLIEREKNWGLADNIVDGVTKIVNQYSKIIVLEDDIVTSKGFLQYMNDALNLYKNEDKVMHISGYMFPVKGTLPPTFFYNVTSCWGWATWQRAWRFYEPSAEKSAKLIAEKDLIYQFNIQGSYNFYGQLLANANQQLKTWAIKWYASIFLNQGFCLHPYPSLVNNIGHDGTGENSKTLTIFNWEKLAEKINVELIEIKKSQKAINLMIKFNKPPKTIENQIKQLIKKIFPKYLIQKLKNLFPIINIGLIT